MKPLFAEKILGTKHPGVANPRFAFKNRSFSAPRRWEVDPPRKVSH